MYKKQHLLLLIFLFSIHTLLFTEIKPVPENLIIFEKADTGYDLYISKTRDINSILLTESQKDPDLKKTNYGLRTQRFHPANGNEVRILDKRILHTRYEAYFLVDSTLEPHPLLGECYHFFLPSKLLYGYKWNRKGSITIGNGARINLRLFKKKYADYSGDFLDQWITLKLRKNPERYRDGVVANLSDFAEDVEGTVTVPEEPFKEVLDGIPDTILSGTDADIVFIIDTTVSMKEEMPWFKKQFPVIRNQIAEKVKTIRIGFIFYRDYGEMFLTKVYDLTDDMTHIDWLVSNIRIDGGEDIPEAMYEAIEELNSISFSAETRYVYLFTDAPAHPVPRGLVTRDDAVTAVENSKVLLHAYCLPFK